MALIFTWDISPEDFDGIIRQPDLVDLIHEFEKREKYLSSTLLAWKFDGDDPNKWVLADFGSEKRKIEKTIYHIDQNKENEGERTVSSVSTIAPDWDSEILKRISVVEKGADINGTREGIIRALKAEHIDREPFLILGGVNLDRLKKNSLTSAHDILDYVIKSPTNVLLSLSYDDIRRIIDNIKYYRAFLNRIRQKHTTISSKGLDEAISKQYVQEVAVLENEIKQSLHQVINVINIAKHSGAISEHKGIISGHEESINILNAEESVSKYKTVFTDQASKHNTASRWWFVGTVGLAIASGVVFLLLVRALKLEGTDLPGILQNVFTKGFLLTLLYLLLNRCIKSYAAEKHLEVVNRHRQNALETFEAFYNTSKNPATQDAVLVAATKAIFDANQSGYLSTKTRGSENANPVQQVIKEFMPEGRSGGGDT